MIGAGAYCTGIKYVYINSWHSGGPIQMNELREADPANPGVKN